MRSRRTSLQFKPGLTAALGLLCLVPLPAFGGQQGRSNQTNYPGVNVQEVPGNVKKLPGVQQSPGATNDPGVYVQEVPSAAKQVPGVGHAQPAIVKDPRVVPSSTEYGRAENQLYRVGIHNKGEGLSPGEGVLSGLQLTGQNNQLWVAPGVATDAWGREIAVPAATSVNPVPGPQDLRQRAKQRQHRFGH